jgi:hypothetical protein
MIEHLGQPCRAKNILSGRIVTDPASGRENPVLANSSEAANVELFFIDFENDTGKVYRAPASQGAWVLEQVPGNRLVVGTYYDGKFLIFDLEKKEFVKTVQVPGEEYVFCGAKGSDGRYYGGTYPHAKLAALDLDSYEVQTWDAAAPKNMYLRWLIPTPDGRLVCNYTTADPKAFVFDPRSHKFAAAPDHLTSFTTAALWDGRIVSGSLMVDGKTLDIVPPPFEPPAKSGWTYLPKLTTTDVLHLRSGKDIYRVHAGEKTPERVCSLDSRIGGFHGISRTGKIVGTVGQDYFVLDPAKGDPQIRPLPVQAAGRPTHFIKSDGKGRLWGGPMFGQTLFWVDLKTLEVVNTGVVSTHGGEVYDIVFHKGKVYAVAYAGGELIEYDPATPFNLWTGGNPRTIATVGGAYIRPVAGISVGPDGKLYSGWMAKYGTYGGAVAITDPETTKTELIKDPLGPQAISGLAVDAKSLYLGTTLGGNGLPSNPEGRTKFAVMDLATRKIVAEQDFGTSTVGLIKLDVKTGLVVMLVGAEVKVFDPPTKEFMSYTTPMPAASGQIDAPGNGRVYYGVESQLVVGT